MIIKPLDRTFPWSMKSTSSIATTLPLPPSISKKPPNLNHSIPHSCPTRKSFSPIVSPMTIMITINLPSPYRNLPNLSNTKKIPILNLPAWSCSHMANHKLENFFIEPKNSSEISFVHLKKLSHPPRNLAPFVALKIPLMAPNLMFSS